MTKKIIRFELRLDPKLHKRIVSIAKNEHRSIHSQMVKYIEDGANKDTPKKK